MLLLLFAFWETFAENPFSIKRKTNFQEDLDQEIICTSRRPEAYFFTIKRRWNTELIETTLFLRQICLTKKEIRHTERLTPTTGTNTTEEPMEEKGKTNPFYHNNKKEANNV